MRGLKRLLKEYIQRCTKWIVRRAGIPQELAGLRDQTQAELEILRDQTQANLETLRTQTQVELEALHRCNQTLTHELNQLRASFPYLWLPDSAGFQQPYGSGHNGFSKETATQLSNSASVHPFAVARSLRILHIGNVANNAYLNACLLNEAGFDCDVLCHEYYHIMGCPEWEDADFVGTVDDFNPDWESVNLQGFQRPRWFAQGILPVCVNYLYARRKRQAFWAAAWWYRLKEKELKLDHSTRALNPIDVSVDLPPIHMPYIDQLIKTFATIYPDRADQLQTTDFDDVFYSSWLNYFKALFQEYDIIHCYATEPIYPLLTGKRPYIAYEHGTIRHIPFENTAQGRRTALAYHQADGVIITNADNKQAADRLRLSNHRFIPHPVNERWVLDGREGELRRQLMQELDADFLVFHPARQDWNRNRDSDIKGNHILIEGLAQFMRQVAPRAAAIFVEWGQNVPTSQALLAELGIADRVKWVKPQHSANMSRYIGACDIVADQFFLGAFGAIMPKALFLGKPTIIYVNEAVHHWCFPEMPPVINAHTPTEVYTGLEQAYRSPDWLQNLAKQGQYWYHRHHSNAVIRDRLIDLYQQVMEYQSPQKDLA